MNGEILIHTINEFNRNSTIFNSLFSDVQSELILWKPESTKWCLLEIICHLYDEEREDFRARIKHVFENPKAALPQIDPTGWVTSRNYIKLNYQETLNNFMIERKESINWLKSLKNSNWSAAYDHPKFGKMTAKMFLSNWLAHDYLHIRQILKLKFDYLKKLTDESLTYAGEW